MPVKDRQMAQLTAELPTISAKIRSLAGAGYARADIARFLGVRYQHVRKVLVDEDVRRGKARTAGRNVAAAGRAQRSVRVRIGPEGRVVIPAPFREALALKEGDVVLARLEENEVHLLTPAAALRRVQAMFVPYRRPEGSEVDEFLAERRRMWGEDDNA
jgi:AbrB family looped-hinge helix DNA binding protein